MSSQRFQEGVCELQGVLQLGRSSCRRRPTWDGDSVPYACRQTPDQGVEKNAHWKKSYLIYRMMIIIFGIMYITGKNAQTGRSS